MESRKTYKASVNILRMMKLSLCLLAIVLISNGCGTPKVVPETPAETIQISDLITVEVKKNTAYTLKTDGTGALYPAFETGNATTLIFKYEEKAPEGIADGNYKETVHVTINNDMTGALLKDAQLQEVNMLFGKFCFCKGEAGYRTVEKGAIRITKDDKSIMLDGSFEIPGISHKINQLQKRILL